MLLLSDTLSLLTIGILTPGIYFPCFSLLSSTINSISSETPKKLSAILSQEISSALGISENDVTVKVSDKFLENEQVVELEFKFADGETITGTGNVAITSLEGDAAADLSNITNTGTRTWV